MAARVVSPRGRGFLLFEAHPDGCARQVSELWEQVPVLDTAAWERRPVALILGNSSGYGMAATIAGLARYGIQGVAVSMEKAPTERRTASAGWYRTRAMARCAERTGTAMSWLNADCFTDETKDRVCDLLAERYGPVDYLVYSVAAPRRRDPDTGDTHSSVIKPIGAEYATKTLEFDDDGATAVRTVGVPSATDEEIASTVKVMGGEDWQRWVRALADRELLANGVRTVALTYIGSELTAPIYRSGTIGRAKSHLETTARQLDDWLESYCGGGAATSVNGAAVTQSSSAIPGIGLYISLLRGALGAAVHSPLHQLVRLWDHLAGVAGAPVDRDDRIRLDDWELAESVQHGLADRWDRVETTNLSELAAPEWFAGEVRRLYGFDVAGIDYQEHTDPELPWPDRQ
ncbi:enoyl-[acyl-carrier protein] reductase / trans-2-enoyl-CoA reductase (NAD+) [Actinopolyspora mzabensis]|uniref:trans-2-enoyl-CoA reductase (NAD(+)) n=1 Tax=Actinopolyspora mzabensis TaxID=995066 RepID=A0A1G8VZW0_ACTMZ|nr:enoyl-[acyl-carrier-protein] reductase FabV [Actinopolyspora mzabensis]SDJ71519.1 enoyl-[acyl-carrier protein] reductase / trans-2-enoyl-CoA reductase (NAD+) [Actinopolyspora mzabensis]